mmetsp:Transcript_17798/g.33547  ORF Transcript_17798/g.33547 Transcript_17798/m.33547 type:complete len:82 (+) Transcript_17798:45-290(+)
MVLYSTLVLVNYRRRRLTLGRGLIVGPAVHFGFTNGTRRHALQPSIQTGGMEHMGTIDQLSYTITDDKVFQTYITRPLMIR